MATSIGRASRRRDRWRGAAAWSARTPTWPAPAAPALRAGALSGDPLLLRGHRPCALVDLQRPQLQNVGIGELGLPGRAALAVEIDEQHAGIGLVAQRAGRIVLAVKDAGAQQGNQLVLVEAFDAVERDRRARFARAEH